MSVNFLTALPTRQLREYIEKKKDEVSKWRSKLGVKLPPSEIVQLLQFVEGAPPGRSAFVRKARIKEIFQNYYENRWHLFDRLPEHAFLVFTPDKADEGEIDWWLTEARLYEDTCALFNLAKEHSEKRRGAAVPKKVNKTRDALYHATVTTAYYFVEAYLNGLAYDHFYKHENTLDDDTKARLRDWDETRKRPILSLRHKALQYPKIVTASRHPPLQESNCPELAYMIGRGKEIRDALVHQSPWPDARTGNLQKTHVLVTLGEREVAEVVDNAIGLIRKIEIAVRGNDIQLFWLFDRGPDGFFPESVFD